MALPVLLAVDDDESLLGDIERELNDRYARHYRVVCARSPAEAREHLADLAASGIEVALVLAGHSAAEPGITDALVRAARDVAVLLAGG